MDLAILIGGAAMLLIVLFFTIGHPILSALDLWLSERESRRRRRKCSAKDHHDDWCRVCLTTKTSD